MEKSLELKLSRNSYPIEFEKPRLIQESVLLFSLVIGLLFGFVGFYQLERLLWNRIPYVTNSGWGNRTPIYRESEYSLQDMHQLIKTNLILYLIGNLIIIILAIIIMINILTKKWNPQNRTLIVVLSLCCVILTIGGFWIVQSLRVIKTLPSLTSVDQSGLEWITIDLAGMSNWIQTLGYWFCIIDLIIFIFGVILLIRFREHKQQVKKTVHSEDHLIVSILKNLPFYIVLIFYLIFTLFPVYLVLKISISSVPEINSHLNPSQPLYSLILNYSSVMFAQSQDQAAFYTSFIYSAIIGIGTGVIGLVISVTAAYALARFNFRGNKLLTFLILATQMFPGIILLIPQYVIWTSLGLTYNAAAPNRVIFGVLLASSTGATAYCTWMMKGYFETIPIDIEEAAFIDGASQFSIFSKISLPLVKSGIVAVMLFTLISSWQDFVLARTFIGQGKVQSTLPLLFYNYQNTSAPDIPTYFELVAPYSILVALPIVVVFILLQKNLTAGAIAGSVK